MAGHRDVSRRAFIAGFAGLAATTRLSAADPPVVIKRVEKLYKIAGCKQPNDLQFVADGLWVLDQVDPNKASRCGRTLAPLFRSFRPNRFTAAGLPTATARSGSPLRK